MKYISNKTKNILLLCLLMPALLSCHAKTVTTSVSGSWKMTLTAPGVGEIALPMDFATMQPDTPGVWKLEAYSEKQGAKKLLGTGKALMAGIFTKKFPKGSLVHMEGKYKQGDSIAAVLFTPMRNFYLYAAVQGNEMDGVLKNGKKEIVGKVHGDKGRPALPLRNYRELAQQILALTEDKIYDPAIVKSKEWKTFRSKLEKMSADCNDDALFIMSFFYHARQLPFTHFALYRYNEEVNLINSSAGNVTIEEKAPGVAYMKITSFGGTPEEMDTAFMQIVNKGYQTLIVDLRDNPGGSVGGGFGFTRHIVPNTIDGGVFLTQQYFRHYKVAPRVSDYHNLVPFSAASYSLIMKGIHEHEGLCLQLQPKAPLYLGKMYVLVNHNTASTCEPIVYGLKQRKRATIIGERTAGAILNGETFALPSGYKLVLPTATYYTSDGVKLDGRGVAPDQKTDPGKALDFVMQEINQKHS